MRVLFGLLFQIAGIFLIGNCFSLQVILNYKSVGVIFLSFGISLWAIGYFLLFDLINGGKQNA